MAEQNIDFSVFEGKMPWKERYQLIVSVFPSVETLDWNEVFRADPAILGRIVNDIIRS